MEEMGLFFDKSQLLKDPYIVSNYWLEAQKNLKLKNKNEGSSNNNLVFLKTHNALISINKKDFTNEKHSLAAIHIVRDPRDVVISYSNFANISYDDAIEEIISKELIHNKNNTLLRITGSWKLHYLSWRDGVPNMPKILIKYEDLLNNTNEEFNNIIHFLSKIIKFNIDNEQINFSIQNSNFDILSKHEKQYGFKEAKNNRPFFHKGKKHQWKDKLSLDQIKKIEKNLCKEMEILGYI